MCQGPKGLAIVMVFMSLGFLAVFIGTFLPHWTEGGDLDIGLFYQCQGTHCEPVHPAKTILYVIDAIILFGLAVSGLSLGSAAYLCFLRCKGEEIPSHLPVGLPFFMIVAAFLSLVGAIVYCTSIHTDDDSYSLSFCPWLVISGASVSGISSLFLPRTVKDVVSQVEPSETNSSRNKKEKKKFQDQDSLDSYEQRQFKIKKYFEDIDMNQHEMKQQQQQYRPQERQQQENQGRQQQHQQHSYDYNEEPDSASGQLNKPLAFQEPRSYPYHNPDPSYPPPPYRINV